MPDVTVHPHGGRWAVVEAGAESPLQEFPTREAAESAARRLAEGGTVDVREEDPTGLGDTAPPGGADDETFDRRPLDGMGDREHIRSEQGGL
ncbi:MAG TPA: DUF2188 domain-containing protein [Nocardioides sp.]|nr:DUF2188 domain-containing protein [Nocardioides sp.]